MIANIFYTVNMYQALISLNDFGGQFQVILNNTPMNFYVAVMAL